MWSEKTGVWGEKGEVYADRISNPLRFSGPVFLTLKRGCTIIDIVTMILKLRGLLAGDPIGLAGGLNVYQYAPNPLGWVDPWGLAKSCGGTTKIFIVQ